MFSRSMSSVESGGAPSPSVVEQSTLQEESAFRPATTPSREAPSPAFSRRFFALGSITYVAGCVVFRLLGEHPTRLDHCAGIIAIGALSASYLLEVNPKYARAMSERRELLSEFAIFVAFLAFYAVTAGIDTSPYDAHVRQAFALIHGHAAIDAPNYIEHAQVGPYSYQLHPLLPSFMLMPVVAIWGMKTSQSYFSIVLGAFDVALAWRLLGRFRLNINARVWLTIFFGAGTIVWFDTVDGSSWAVSMTVAIWATLLALDETFCQARPWIVGLFAGIAGMARYDLAFVWPVYLLLLFGRGRRSVRELIWCFPGFALTAATYGTFNFVRYQSFFDRGVTYYMPASQRQLFALRFFVGNFYTLFFMAPGENGTFPYIHPTFGGQALLTTSPAFLLALRASCRKLENVLLAMGALIVMTPSLFYVGNGASQFGARHYMQAYPFFLVLMAIGMHRRIDQFSRILIAASIFLIAFGVWHIRFYGFG
jgi:hypothetical protein